MKLNLNLFIYSMHHYNILFLTNFFAAAIACGFFLFMFGGVASDCWIAVIAGGSAFLTFSFVQRYIQIKFFSEFVAAAVVISIAATFTKLGIANQSRYHYYSQCHATLSLVY